MHKILIDGTKVSYAKSLKADVMPGEATIPL